MRTWNMPLPRRQLSVTAPVRASDPVTVTGMVMPLVAVVDVIANPSVLPRGRPTPTVCPIVLP